MVFSDKIQVYLKDTILLSNQALHQNPENYS